MKKMGIFLLMITFVMVNTSNVTYADTELSGQQQQFTEVSDKLKDLDIELTNISNDISALNTNISNNEASIHATETEIQNTDAKINSLQDEIDANEESLSIRLREMYKSNSFSGFNYVKFIFESKSITDLFNRINACNIIINEDKKLIDGIKSDVNDLNEAREEISKKKNTLVSLNEETKSKLNEVKAKEASLNETKAKLDSEKAALHDTIKSNEYKLISPYINTINSSNSYADIKSAIDTLDSLKAQVTIDEVSSKINDNIANAKSKLDTLAKESAISNISQSNTLSTAPPAGGTTYTMEATAYCGGTLTASGSKPVRIPGGISTIAVDPSIIKLGTKVYVSGYGYAVATDTGGDIKGMRVDLYMNSEAECFAFGRRNVTVQIVS